MKKIVIGLLVAILVLGGMAGYTLSTKNNEKEDGKKLNILCTTFPQYDWVRGIVGDEKNVNVSFLVDDGVDLHSYQPTTQDMVKISKCDLFVYVGGQSENWVKDALKQSGNKKAVEVNLMEAIGSRAKPEELSEGMEDHDHDHDHDGENGHHHEDEDHHHDDEADHDHEKGAKDEHIWLSLKNAEICVEAISKEIIRLDPDNAEAYKKNTREYLKKIKELDDAYEKAVAGGKKKTVLFGDRFPFRYLMDDYGLKYYGAFPGCSAETEASFETVIFLAKKVDEEGLSAILVLEGSNQKIAGAIKDNTKDKGQKILTLNSMQSVTAKDVEEGTTYLSVMEDNLKVLKEALK